MQEKALFELPNIVCGNFFIFRKEFSLCEENEMKKCARFRKVR